MDTSVKFMPLERWSSRLKPLTSCADLLISKVIFDMGRCKFDLFWSMVEMLPNDLGGTLEPYSSGLLLFCVTTDLS